jgi:hypothetical protein
MHLPSLLILALSAGALALPSEIAKRKSGKPTIAGYSDAACQNQVAVFQTIDGCVSIGITSKYIGINWGSWPNGIDAFDAFTDVSMPYSAPFRSPLLPFHCFLKEHADDVFCALA